MKPAVRAALLAGTVLPLLAMRIPAAPVPASVAAVAAALAIVAGAGGSWTRRIAWTAMPAVVALAAVPASHQAPLGSFPWALGAALVAGAVAATLPAVPAPPVIAGGAAPTRRPVRWALTIALAAAPLGGAALLGLVLPAPLALAFEMRSGGAVALAAAFALGCLLAASLALATVSRDPGRAASGDADAPVEAAT